MPERRGSRFVVEALFLAALTVALALAHLDALEIVGAMALGWLLVAAIEWSAWRGEPHFGAGLPPRYHLPRADLPPPQLLEQVEQGYPDSGRNDAPTWIASADLRAEVHGAWPVAAIGAPDDDEVDDEPQPVFASPSASEDPWTAIALPPTPVAPPASDSGGGGESRRSKDAQVSWYSLDPLEGPAPKRRLRRGGSAESGIQLPSRPGLRVLPSSSDRTRSRNHRNG